MSKPSSSDVAACRPSPATERALLRLAGIAIDMRGMLSPHEISKVPALKRALNALDDVFCARCREVREPHAD